MKSLVALTWRNDAMDQYNMFGQIEEMKETEKPSRKFKTMQEMYGCTEGETCRTCGNLLKHQWDKTYYKCSLWHVSNCSATDIRLKDKACGKWVPGKD
jgi:hypothetical protein